MKKIIGRFLRKNLFKPHPIVGIFINPFFFIRRGIYGSICDFRSYSLSKRVLDVGCGTTPYKSVLGAKEYIGLDLEGCKNFESSRGPDVLYDGVIMPFDDASFDVVLSSEVLEHVKDLGTFLSEIRRVLRPGGEVLITCPFMWNEHEQPNDHRRLTSYGIVALFEESGFDVISAQKKVVGLEAHTQLFTAYLYENLASKNRILALVFTCTVIAPLNLFGLLVSRFLPTDDSFYLTNAFIGRKI